MVCPRTEIRRPVTQRVVSQLPVLSHAGASTDSFLASVVASRQAPARVASASSARVSSPAILALSSSADFESRVLALCAFDTSAAKAQQRAFTTLFRHGLRAASCSQSGHRLLVDQHRIDWLVLPRGQAFIEPGELFPLFNLARGSSRTRSVSAWACLVSRFVLRQGKLLRPLGGVGGLLGGEATLPCSCASSSGGILGRL